MSVNGLLGSGYVFFRETSWPDERLIANTENFDIAPSHETADRQDTNGGPLFLADRQIVRAMTSITFGTTDINLQNLQLLFGAQGASGEVTGGGSPFVSAGSSAGGWHQFTGQPMPASVSGVSYANEGSPVEGTHYKLVASSGRIQTLQDGLGAVTVTHSVVSNAYGFAVAPVDAVRGELRLIGGNTAHGHAWNVHVADCVLTPSGSLAMKSREEFSRIVWSVEVLNNSLTVTGPAVPPP